MRQDYEFIDLHGKDHLIEDIQKLEQKMQKETGQKVNLIAYSQQNSISRSECREID